MWMENWIVDIYLKMLGSSTQTFHAKRQDFLPQVSA